MARMNKISPNLWFDGQAEQAADFYVSIFKNASKEKVSYYNGAGKDIHGHDGGAVLTVEFTLEGQTYLALNRGTNLNSMKPSPLLLPAKPRKKQIITGRN